MRGDISALKRIDKSDKRANKLQRRLNRILRKKDKKSAPSIVAIPIVLHHFCPWYSQASCDMAERYKRRLVSATSEGNRAFYVTDFGNGHGIIVSARDVRKGLGVEIAANAIGGRLSSWPSVRGLLPLLETSVSVHTLVPCAAPGCATINGLIFKPDACTPIIFLSGDMPFGIACEERCSPFDACISNNEFLHIQQQVVRMLGLTPKTPHIPNDQNGQ